MPVQLKPGGMGLAIPGGTPAEFADSMAARMEEALNELLDEDGLRTLPTNDNSRETRDRRRLFVAIARGIVRHLEERAEAVTFPVPDVGGPTRPVHPTLDIEGTPWP
jgi:hypothetical protein